MMFIAIAVTLFALGVIVERSGRKLGTVLALLPVLVWFWLLVRAQIDGGFGERESRDHAIALLIGLLCFMAGSFLAGPVAGWFRKRRVSPADATTE